MILILAFLPLVSAQAMMWTPYMVNDTKTYYFRGMDALNASFANLTSQSANETCPILKETPNIDVKIANNYPFGVTILASKKSLTKGTCKLEFTDKHFNDTWTIATYSGENGCIDHGTQPYGCVQPDFLKGTDFCLYHWSFEPIDLFKVTCADRCLLKWTWKADNEANPHVTCVDIRLVFNYFPTHFPLLKPDSSLNDTDLANSTTSTTVIANSTSLTNDTSLNSTANDTTLTNDTSITAESTELPTETVEETTSLATTTEADEQEPTVFDPRNSTISIPCARILIH